MRRASDPGAGRCCAGSWRNGPGSASAHADRERILVLGTDGEIVASSQQVDVTTSAGTRAVDLTAFAEGRHAVLDELAAAVSGASGAAHDLAWGYESLRTCEDIERASRGWAPSQPAGSASSR